MLYYDEFSNSQISETNEDIQCNISDNQHKIKMDYHIYKNIFTEHEDKILFHRIEHLPNGDDYINILNVNILNENKRSWVIQVHARDCIQKELLCIS